MLGMCWMLGAQPLRQHSSTSLYLGHLCPTFTISIHQHQASSSDLTLRLEVSSLKAEDITTLLVPVMLKHVEALDFLASDTVLQTACMPILDIKSHLFGVFNYHFA